MKSNETLIETCSKAKRRIDTTEFFALVLEALEAGSRVAFTPRGRSMLPTLRDATDVVYLERATNPAKYDVVLYRRDTGQYVLHRIVGVASDGTFVLCGDGQTALEFGIRREQILANVVAFRRGKTDVDCQKSCLFGLYSRFWVATRPFRAFYFRARRGLGRIIRRTMRGVK